MNYIQWGKAEVNKNVKDKQKTYHNNNNKKEIYKLQSISQ